MLFFMTIFCGILWTSFAEENKVMLRVSPGQVIELRSSAEICGKETGVDPKELPSVVTGDLPNDEPHKQFLYCLFFTSGYVQEDGHFNKNKSLQLMPVNGTVKDVENIIDECDKTTRDNNLDTIYEMYICFQRHFIPKIEKPNTS